MKKPSTMLVEPNLDGCRTSQYVMVDNVLWQCLCSAGKTETKPVSCSGGHCERVLETLCLAQVAIEMGHRGEESVRSHLQSTEKDTDEGQQV